VPEAVVNFIALLGWSPESDQEIFSLDELIEQFDYRRISKSSAVFDIVKLRWMNGEYLKAMDSERFYEMAYPYVKDILPESMDYKKVLDLVKTRIEVFPDIAGHIDFFAELPDYDIAMYTHKKMKTNTENSLQALKEMMPMLEAHEDYSAEGIKTLTMSYIESKGIKNGLALWPLRTAVSGKQMTPGGAYEIMEILGKEESLRRIRIGIEKLEAAL